MFHLLGLFAWLILLVAIYLEIGVILVALMAAMASMQGNFTTPTWSSVWKWPVLFSGKALTKVVFIFLLLAGTAHAYTVTLQWDANTDTDLAGYKLYYAIANVQPFTGTGATQGVSPVIIPKGTQIGSLAGLDPAKPYFFAVTAYNTSGLESAYSNIVTVPIIPPIANLKAIVTQNTIILSWNAMVGITEYQVYDAKTGAVIQRVAAPALTATITGIPGGRAFYVTGSGPSLFAVASTSISIPNAVTGMKATVVIP